MLIISWLLIVVKQVETWIKEQTLPPPHLTCSPPPPPTHSEEKKQCLEFKFDTIISSGSKISLFLKNTFFFGGGGGALAQFLHILCLELEIN